MGNRGKPRGATPGGSFGNENLLPTGSRRAGAPAPSGEAAAAGPSGASSSARSSGADGGPRSGRYLSWSVSPFS